MLTEENLRPANVRATRARPQNRQTLARLALPMKGNLFLRSAIGGLMTTSSGKWGQVANQRAVVDVDNFSVCANRAGFAPSGQGSTPEAQFQQLTFAMDVPSMA